MTAPAPAAEKADRPTSADASPTQPLGRLGLLPQHANLIAASGVSSAVAEARGYRSVTTPEELVDLGFERWQARVPALVIPQWGVDGKVVGQGGRRDAGHEGSFFRAC